MYKKEEKYEFRYAVPTSEGNWKEKVIYPKSKESVNENKAKCKEFGYKFISAKKLYPFSTMKNQHNFDLINSIVKNELYDIWNGDKKVSNEEYERLEHLAERAEYFFCQPLPIAWLTWEEWKEANEMAQNAIIHRQNACIENGRPDLVKYC